MPKQALTMPASVDLFGNRLVVLSPHLDDAALSLGATIARAVQGGSSVTIVTVLAGDPNSRAPAGPWDLHCGFSSAAEAIRERRVEDARACEILGADPVWLPFGDEEQAQPDTDDQIWEALSAVVVGADAVLTPGYPLHHADHARLTHLLLERGADVPIALYVEQPYAANAGLGRGYSLRPLIGFARLAASNRGGLGRFAPTLPASIASFLSGVTWRRFRPTRHERHLKDASIRAYESQFGVDRLGRRLLTRIRLYESATGGEHVGLLNGRLPRV
jgi:LmbE family N-acetylglucosaminyl deacetylase